MLTSAPSNRDVISADDAAELYGVRNWGAGYFDVGPDGTILVRPDGPEGDRTISMMDIVEGLEERGMDMPVLVRFGDILASQIATINQSFARAIHEAKYQGLFRGVYPIKVNQQEQVLEEVVEHGKAFHHGLESGSKAELIAAMATMTDEQALLICNGYKDAEFIDLALSMQQLGMQVILVIELPDELSLILDRAERMGVSPWLGVRAKLATQAPGHWQASGGDRSKFGLNSSQIIDVVDALREAGKLDCLRLLHFHLGSQISDIRSVRCAVSEAARFYSDLVAEGAAMGYLDMGGGLAVDYDGTHSNSSSSANYGITEYAVGVVETVMSTLDEASIPHPTLVSESGRATAAHHSVLLFNVLDVTRMESHDIPESLPEDAHDQLHNLLYTAGVVKANNVQECFHDATYYRDEVRALFQHGVVSLRDRAMAERIFWQIARKIADLLPQLEHIPDELEFLQVATADMYHCNFSVFQSLPDAWAIDQLFPVMPIHRLDQRPTREATIADITCDCDGSLSRFIDKNQHRHTLPLHPLEANSPYYLGVFLVGAYQETLGDLHNLLGDTNVVNVRLSDKEDFEFDREISGDTVAEVLSYVEYSPSMLVEKLRRKAESAVREGRITPTVRKQIMQAFEAGLRGSTYFRT